MAFGRANSLSINTGAANSVFGGPNQTTQPATATTTQPTGLFGSTATSQPQQSAGLFGSNNNATNTTNATGGGLFGSNNNATATSNATGGGLFGSNNNTTNPSNTTGGSLFGSTAQQSQPQQTSGLFGAAQNQTQNQPASQPAQSSLFGGLNNNNNNNQPKPAGSMFGGFGQQQASQQTQNGGVFGLGQNKPAGSSLFGTSTTQQQPQSQAQQQPSLLAASLFNNSTTTAPLAGSLTMGQGNAAPTTQPGVKIDLSNLRPTTRFSDLHDELKSQIELIDNFIKQQESYASQCEALLPSHSSNMATVAPDVSLIESKVETVELGLENDGRNISAAKETLKTDVKDLTRCIRVIENQSLPSRFHYGPGGLPSTTNQSGSSSTGLDDDYDVDLLGYFSRQADAMQVARATFEQNLADIEAHLGVVERRTAAMIGEVGRDRAGAAAGNGRPGDDTVRELADTLRGFEGGILDAARAVGACREGLEDLVVGRRY